MHVKGASGSLQTATNDPGAQQPSQMFLTCVKARPQHRNFVPYSSRIVCGFFNVPQLFATRVVRRDLRLIVLIREFSLSKSLSENCIKRAPEIWQRKMLEHIEGLKIVEVITDDFVMAGCGNTLTERQTYFDRNVCAFLDGCLEKNLKLNKYKARLKQHEVSFIGHIPTPQGPETHARLRQLLTCQTPLMHSLCSES